MQKNSSADEFLVKKKDPLILPPDFENLPIPDEVPILLEESSIFKNTLEDDSVKQIHQNQNLLNHQY